VSFLFCAKLKCFLNVPASCDHVSQHVVVMEGDVELSRPVSCFSCGILIKMVLVLAPGMRWLISVPGSLKFARGLSVILAAMYRASVRNPWTVLAAPSGSGMLMPWYVALHTLMKVY
jgi:hypothetical protein